ncbi:hypothetical protein ABT154_04880 [Streptomyces sp. NPDC001728]|uniref:hypothetical protein n=1 Tax=Streptomyces sp. NPDC001728 TaxID=3154396 RepID=UPI003322224D
MSFGTYARRARDEGLPPARRHRALRSAVSEYCPLGFHATWAYLAVTARPSPDLRRDPAALLRALDALEASRAVRTAGAAAFAARRRVEKAAGLRTPAGEPFHRPWRPHWPCETAPSRLGLVAAVADGHRTFRRLPHPDPALVPEDRAQDLAELHGRLDACGTAYLTALGRPDDPVREELADTLAGIGRQLAPGYAPLDLPLLRWLRFAELLAYAASAPAAPAAVGA